VGCTVWASRSTTAFRRSYGLGWRELPATASAFSITAVPVVGILSATWIVGEIPGWQDWIAAVFVVGAIATTLLARKPTSLKP
jgi:drug/metabolite transporter (DMT)-like permease